MPVVLYEKQRETLDFISQFIQKHGYSPTLQEVADAMNLNSLATVHEHVKSLVRKGVIKKTGGRKNRQLEIVDENIAKIDSGIRLPVLGFISADKPLEEFSDPKAYIYVAPKVIKGKRRAYALRIRGSSLQKEGFLDGDYIVVEEEQQLKDGQTAVLILEDKSAVVKKFFKEKTRIRLESVNPRLEPTYVNKVKIQGEAIFLIRNF